MSTKPCLARTTNRQTMPWPLRTACATILLPLLLFLCVPTVKADLQYGDFLYTTNANTATITGYTGSGGDVAIPSAIDGLPVTTIGDWAFAWCTSLTNVTIGNIVTNIGDSAFAGCTGLTNVTIGNSVTRIGDSAFYVCSSLTR